jgi:hypothetical protein
LSRRWWIAVGALFVLVWWLVPPLLYRHTGTGPEAKLKAVTDTRTALLAGLIGVGALLTFWLNSRVYRISAETLRVTEQGQITERYTKAIEQLGNDKLDVRLGGIYALERVARDSARDHATIMEVLSTYVREHSREPWSAPSQSDAEYESSPRPDVQAAVTVVGRRDSKRGDVTPIDLHGANLANAYLVNANLANVGLLHSDLTEAVLQNADLTQAILTRANLASADLLNADLTRAYLADANLNNAHLLGANLTGAILANSDLTDAQLTSADPVDAIFGDAVLTGAVFSDANLTGAFWPAAAIVPEGWVRDPGTRRLSRANTSADDRPLPGESR